MNTVSDGITLSVSRRIAKADLIVTCLTSDYILITNCSVHSNEQKQLLPLLPYVTMLGRLRLVNTAIEI